MNIYFDFGVALIYSQAQASAGGRVTNGGTILRLRRKWCHTLNVT